MDWIRGEKLGHGAFATVNLAVPRNQSSEPPPLMAVKSCGFSLSSSLVREKLILEELRGCPEIIHCFGDSFSYENGEKMYNILLEYAPGGSLADKIRNSGDRRLPEFEVRRHARALLRGLDYVHKLGYVHCDLKLQNILLCRNGAVKIADFGLAKRGVERESDGCLRGTPLYMSPEMVSGGEQGPAADIWALGCAVAEMVTGSPAWRCADVVGLLMKIGAADESPGIPENLSDSGKDFLEKCFDKDPRERWTAEMLLDHPFIRDGDFGDECENTISPRCPFDFPGNWVDSSATACSITSLALPEYSPGSGSWWSTAAAEQLRELVGDQSPSSSVWDDSWVTVR